MTERGMERERHTMKRKCIFFTYNYRYYSPELGRSTIIGITPLNLADGFPVTHPKS